ncbi:polysaccharide deacetylase family protein [Marinomonas communis]|uniref:Polysaccharide deacetylase n=1 Tax=Marinomonas communis TaxID=28254 RepID=A0A4R6X249_9GAMM|nr:polysaccharide deacetylase family protein [Marinomonas communis]TDR05923.1 polysaccharide deacetylase [Marinomonas communis]
MKLLPAALLSACCVTGAAHAQEYLPILQYHHVDASTPRSTSVSPEEFKQHMDYLKEAGYQVLDLATALQSIRSDQPLPDKAVAITFDDAYLNIYENGFPILKEHGFPFTVFINTGPIERGHRSFLTWSQMEEMQKSGGVFANHTVSHPYMLRLEEGETVDQWEQRIQQEVSDVESLLSSKLGSTPKMIAYPYGESNEVVRNLIRDQDMVGFGQQSGVVSKDSDFANLPRFPAAGPYAELSSLKVKLRAKPMPLNAIENGGDFANEQPVKMTLTLKEGRYRKYDLNCYVAGQGKASLNWVDDNVVVVEAERAFPVGRGRINCTMPDQSGRHYYWFSNVWIRTASEQRYVTD